MVSENLFGAANSGAIRRLSKTTPKKVWITQKRFITVSRVSPSKKNRKTRDSLEKSGRTAPSSSRV